LFNQLGEDTNGVINRNGALFYINMSVAFSATQNIILIFPDERPVFLREVNGGMYSVSAYFFAKITAEFPLSIIIPVLYSVICYFSIGLNLIHASKFFMFIFILFMLYAAAGAYGLILSVLFSDVALAISLTPVVIIPFMLFAGFFVN